MGLDYQQRKEKLKEFKKAFRDFHGNLKSKVQNEHTLKYASQFTIIPRRALLRIGMLLRDSEAASQVRTMLLNKEEMAIKYGIA